MLTDEDERWYGDLIGETAYDKLLDLRRKHLKLLTVCGKSKQWWNGEITARFAVVRDHQRRYGRNGEEVWTEWGVGKGEVQATQPDSGWETEMLGRLLHRIGGEVTMGGSSVGKGPLAVEGKNGPPTGDGWGVARI